jgi:hypothetical protein
LFRESFRESHHVSLFKDDVFRSAKFQELVAAVTTAQAQQDDGILDLSAASVNAFTVALEDVVKPQILASEAKTLRQILQ